MDKRVSKPLDVAARQVYKQSTWKSVLFKFLFDHVRGPESLGPEGMNVQEMSGKTKGSRRNQKQNMIKGLLALFFWETPTLTLSHLNPSKVSTKFQIWNIPLLKNQDKSGKTMTSGNLLLTSRPLPKLAEPVTFSIINWNTMMTENGRKREKLSV